MGADGPLIEGNLEAVPLQEVEKLAYPGARVQARETRALEAMEHSEGREKDKCCRAAAAGGLCLLTAVGGWGGGKGVWGGDSKIKPWWTKTLRCSLEGH